MAKADMTLQVDIKPNARELYMYFIDEYIRCVIELEGSKDFFEQSLKIIEAYAHLRALNKTASLYNVMKREEGRPTMLTALMYYSHRCVELECLIRDIINSDPDKKGDTLSINIIGKGEGDERD